MPFSINPETNRASKWGVDFLIKGCFPRIEVGRPGNERDTKPGKFTIFQFQGPSVPTHLAVHTDAKILQVDNRTGAITYSIDPPNFHVQELSLHVTNGPLINYQSREIRDPADAAISVSGPGYTQGGNILGLSEDGTLFTNAQEHRFLQVTQVVALVGCRGKITPEKPRGTDPSYHAIALVEPATVVRSR